jgi:hypothetical protein
MESTFVGSNTLGLLQTLAMAGPYGDGLLIINIFAMPGEDLPGVKRMVEVSKNFGDKWMPAEVKLHPYYVYGWINSIVFAEAAKRSRERPDPGRADQRPGILPEFRPRRDDGTDHLHRHVPRIAGVRPDDQGGREEQTLRHPLGLESHQPVNTSSATEGTEN